MSKEHLLQQLQPVDFKAVAEHGAFVYCYLRSTDLTPYYVGMASISVRPFQRHSCNIPANCSLIRVLRSGLSWDEALQWEMTFIRHYGRKDTGTGILRNLTDGGEGVLGMIHTAETKQILREKCTLDRFNDERSEELAEELEDAGVIAASTYMAMSYKDRQAFRKYLDRNPEGTHQQWENNSPSEYAKRGARGREVRAAEKWGVPIDVWDTFSEADRTAVKAYIKRNPSKTHRDWLDRKGSRELGPADRRNSLRAAKRWGVTVDDWCSLSARERSAFREWKKINPQGALQGWQKVRRSPNN